MMSSDSKNYSLGERIGHWKLLLNKATPKVIEEDELEVLEQFGDDREEIEQRYRRQTPPGENNMDVEDEGEEETSGQFTRGGKSSDGGKREDRSDIAIDPDERITEIEEKADENNQLTWENRVLLRVLDERTSLITKLVIGLIVTVLGGIILQAILFLL